MQLSNGNGTEIGSNIAVFGAGGRAGRAITAEALARGHRVTAVVRDPGKHDLDAAGVTVVAGDVTDPESTLSTVRGHDAVVCTVTPASDPAALANLDRLDEGYFVSAVDSLLAAMTTHAVPRLIHIGLFANLVDGQGRMVADDAENFPAQFRPFALAHTAGLDRLRAADTPVDWLEITPPALLVEDAPRLGGYHVGGDTVPSSPAAQLSYADLAVAVVDEIELPRHHRTRISVFNEG
jgi:putative NADH-flavin reductase